MTPPRDVEDAAPYNGNTETFPQLQTGAAAWGQAALRPTRKYLLTRGTSRTPPPTSFVMSFPPSVGAGFLPSGPYPNITNKKVVPTIHRQHDL